MRKITTRTVGKFYYVLILCVLILLTYIGITENVAKYESRAEDDFRIIHDNKPEIAEDFNGPIGIKKEYKILVDDMETAGNYFSFYVAHQYVDVYFDDELVYSLRPDANSIIGKTVGSCWVMLPLYSEDANKTVTVDVFPIFESVQNRKVDFFIGTQRQVYLYQFKVDHLQVIASSIAIVVGITFLLCSIYGFIRNKRGRSLASLGLFSLILGIWRLSDTRFFALIFTSNPKFGSFLVLTMLMLLVVPFLLNIQLLLKERKSKILNWLGIAIIVIDFIMLLLQITNIYDLRETLIISQGTIIVTAIAIFGVFIRGGALHQEAGEKKLTQILFLVSILCAVADILLYYLSGNSANLVFTLFGFLVYIISTGIMIILKYFRQERKIKEQEAELANNRISIMMSQIQPHFLYNSLNTIYFLCGKNPDMAKQAVSDFSDYLRCNLDSLKITEPVPFETELKHVKTYLSLEEMRFGEELNIVYSIETTDFKIPALTLQPLVENAVKHGVGMAEGGGTVLISTKETEENYLICVSDDGVGFDPSEKKSQQNNQNRNIDITTHKSHVGIENVKARLKDMSNGTIEIFSEKGKGTSACIYLPKGGKK